MPSRLESKQVAASVTDVELHAYHEAADRLGVSMTEFIRRSCALAVMVEELRERPTDYVIMQAVSGDSRVVGQHIIPPEKL